MKEFFYYQNETWFPRQPFSGALVSIDLSDSGWEAHLPAGFVKQSIQGDNEYVRVVSKTTSSYLHTKGMKAERRRRKS